MRSIFRGPKDKTYFSAIDMWTRACSMSALVMVLWGHFFAGALSAQEAAVKTGAEVLAAREFADFRGKRVGLIINHTALVNGRHLVSVMHEAPEVTVGAIFGPEHGWRGTEEDGVAVSDGIDTETGAYVHSLYGQHRQPTSAMLNGLDILVFDIQDVGARFYTFISTMGLAMQAAAAAELPFVVLDRPNPLSGNYVSGFVLEAKQVSFVGQYPIPIVHGMTTGELARMIAAENLLPGLQELQLEVIPMEGYYRTMQWPDTHRPWVNTSPNIPAFVNALVYPGTCFFEATAASEGRGTRTPFVLLGAPWAEGEDLARQLNDVQLPGVEFLPARFTPEPIPGMDINPKLEGEVLSGIRIQVTDRKKYMPVETGIHILHAFYAAAPDKNAFLSRPEWLNRLSGTQRLLRMLQEGYAPEAIIRAWEPEVRAFREMRAMYLLYD